MTWADTLPKVEPHIGLVVMPISIDLINSGKWMDIAPASAMICHASEDGTPLIDEDGKVTIAFEGNVNGAVNLERFHEKCMCAAGRLSLHYPSIAYARVSPEDLMILAKYDMKSYSFIEIIDEEEMDLWSGDPASTYMPPPIDTPCSDPEALKAVFDLPMSFVTSGLTKIFKLQDGKVLVHSDELGTVLFRPTDDALKAVSYLQFATPDEMRKIFGVSEGH
jgi:hypothetical protein